MPPLTLPLPKQYLARLARLREHAERQVPEIAQQFSNFTSHGVDHFDEVARLAKALSEPIALTVDERFCLFAACYLHDLGMSHTRAQQVFKIRHQEKLRVWHAKLSSQHINTLNAADFGGEGLRDIVGRVSEGHGRWDWDHADFNSLHGVRIRLLVALLSLADILDVRSERRVPRKDVETVEHLMNIEALKTDISRVHWLKHYYSQQASVQKADGRSVEIVLHANVGVRHADETGHTLDDREPVIKQLIQAEILDLLENATFKEHLTPHLDVRLKPAPGKWPSYVHSRVDASKMLFPEALIATALEAGMVGCREIPLDRTTYYDARIEPFVGPDDLLVSVAWLPTFATKTNLPDGASRDVHGMLARLAERTWDYVLWPTAPYLSRMLADLNSGNEKEARERINRSLHAPQSILDGHLRKYYIATDTPSEPLAATPYVAKFGQYLAYPSRDNFQGGSIHIRTQKQRSNFDITCATVADKLHLHDVPPEQLPARLREIAHKDTAYDVTVASILHVLHCIEERLKGQPHAAFRDFVAERRNRLLCDTGHAQQRADALLAGAIDIVATSRETIDALLVLEEESSGFPWTNAESFVKHVESGSAHSVVLAGRIMGYVLTSPQGTGELLLVKMAIHPAYRRRGFAGRILDHVQTLASAGRHPWVELHVRASNAPAIALYERHGYTVVEQIRNYYDKTGATEDDKNALKMRRRV